MPRRRWPRSRWAAWSWTRSARPARAVAALNKALALGAPQSLREDVRARLVEAHARAGDQAAARSAGDAYRREFPAGRHAKTIESLLARP